MFWVNQLKITRNIIENIIEMETAHGRKVKELVVASPASKQSPNPMAHLRDSIFPASGEML